MIVHVLEVWMDWSQDAKVIGVYSTEGRALKAEKRRQDREVYPGALIYKAEVDGPVIRSFELPKESS